MFANYSRPIELTELQPVRHVCKFLFPLTVLCSNFQSLAKPQEKSGDKILVLCVGSIRCGPVAQVGWDRSINQFVPADRIWWSSCILFRSRDLSQDFILPCSLTS